MKINQVKGPWYKWGQFGPGEFEEWKAKAKSFGCSVRKETITKKYTRYIAIRPGIGGESLGFSTNSMNKGCLLRGCLKAKASSTYHFSKGRRQARLWNILRPVLLR